MTVTRFINTVIVVEASDSEIQARHTVARQTLAVLSLEHYDHHARQAEATFSNLCRAPNDLPRARAMRDPIAASLEAMEAKVSSLEAEGEAENRSED